jgi:Protein of unknown function (DUF4236)
MGFRFQKRIKILPGITLNLSRKGVSTSVGVTGARVTLGHGQQRITTGLPGSGISHTSITTTNKAPTPRLARAGFFIGKSSASFVKAIFKGIYHGIFKR